MPFGQEYPSENGRLNPTVTPRPRCEKCGCALRSEEAKRRGLCYPCLYRDWVLLQELNRWHKSMIDQLENEIVELTTENESLKLPFWKRWGKR